MLYRQVCFVCITWVGSDNSTILLSDHQQRVIFVVETCFSREILFHVIFEQECSIMRFMSVPTNPDLENINFWKYFKPLIIGFLISCFKIKGLCIWSSFICTILVCISLYFILIILRKNPNKKEPICKRLTVMQPCHDPWVVTCAKCIIKKLFSSNEPGFTGGSVVNVSQVVFLPVQYFRWTQH